MLMDIFKKIKSTIMHNKNICIVLLLIFSIVTLFIDSFARYAGELSKKANLKVARLVIETNIESLGTNLARGKDIKHYFTIDNYNTDGVTEVAYDYYVFIYDENDEIIENAKLFKYKVIPSDNLITQENPNTYVEIEKEADGNYKGGFYGGEMFLSEQEDKFKIEITDIQNKEVRIKTIAIQKEVTM